MSEVTEPLFSVVIPTWNRARSVGHAILSALAQTRPPVEVVVVDDGSADDTGAVVNAFGGVVRYVRQENGGAASARNRGVRECVSPWVAFLDSDDTWDAGHLARMAMAIRRTEARAGLYFADTRFPVEEGSATLWERAAFLVEGPFRFATDATEWAMFRFQPMMLQSSVVGKQTYLEVGGLWEKLRTREDTHLFCRLSVGRPVCAVSGIGAVMRSVDPAMRLTAALGHQTEAYWRCSVLLWQDVLDRFPGLDSRHRRMLKRRLGASFLALARFAAKRGKLGQFAQSSAKSFALHPGGVFAAVGRRFTRRRGDQEMAIVVR